MKTKFEKLLKLQKQLNKVQQDFNEACQDKYGFTYNDTDDDVIIDALDYGRVGLSFNEFDKRMQEHRKHFDKTGEF